MNLRRGKRGPWLGCSAFPKCRGRSAWTAVDEALQKKLEKLLDKHDKEHPKLEIKTMSGKPIAEGTPVSSLLSSGRVAELAVHPQAAKELGVPVAVPAGKRAKA
jgi:DNA topoisomerase-1